MKKITPEILGYVKASEYRKNVIHTLKDEVLRPVEIADQTKYHQSHVSSTLADLAKLGLVKCINPKLRKGRLYALTDNGKKICDKLCQ